MVYLPKKYMRDAKGLKVVKFRKNPLDDKYMVKKIKCGSRTGGGDK